MSIRGKTEEKAQLMTDQLMVQAQGKFIKWLMKQENCDATEAWAIVEGRTEPIEYEYMLSFKLANPVLQIALFKQVSKKARLQAAENFAMGLSDQERKIFYSEVFNEETAGKFKKALKKEKKKRGVDAVEGS